MALPAAGVKKEAHEHLCQLDHPEADEAFRAVLRRERCIRSSGPEHEACSPPPPTRFHTYIAQSSPGSFASAVAVLINGRLGSHNSLWQILTDLSHCPSICTKEDGTAIA